MRSWWVVVYGPARGRPAFPTTYPSNEIREDYDDVHQAGLLAVQRYREGDGPMPAGLPNTLSLPNAKVLQRYGGFDAVPLDEALVPLDRLPSLREMLDTCSSADEPYELLPPPQPPPSPSRARSL